MLARFHRAPCAVALAVLGLIACAPATSRSLSESRYRGTVLPLTPTARVIDAERIRRSGSQTALDAVRALVPGFNATHTRSLGAGWLNTHTMGRGEMRVLVDNHPILDAESLRTIRASDILAIHVLSAPDATTRLGPSFTGGAILIQTLATLRML